MELYGSIQSISGSMTASVFTGSFKGDGSGLYGISADGVTGLNLSQISTGSITASVSPNGFNVNSDTSITGTLKVSGTLIAEQIDVTIYSSSVLYQSGSTRFGDSVDDNHDITGSVNITGSISLNGEPIGTGKLNETTFNSYTSSNDSKVSALESTTASLNSFTSSIDTTIKNKLNTDNVVSGSIQIDITGTTGFSSFSSSLAATDLVEEMRVISLETSSGSLNSFSSSALSRLTAIETSTSSLNTFSASANNKIGLLETASSSLNNFTSSIDTTIKNKLNSDGVLSGSIQVDITQTTNYTSFSSSIATTDLNQSNKISAIETATASINSYTASNNSRVDNIETSTSSLNIFTSSVNNKLNSIETSTGSLNSFTSSIDTTIKNKLNVDGVISGSIQVDLTQTTGYSTFSSSVSSSIDELSGSIATTTNGLSTSVASYNLGQDNRLNSLEEKTGSYATTGSNVFVGNQTITGSVIITENLQVFGSSSITYVTASQLAVSTSFISVNVFEPAERFGGLKVFDSGSSAATASLAWDSLNNRWVYQNVSGSNYSGGMLISGPRNTGSLGDEPSLTSGKIPKSIGGDHIGDSIMNETSGVIYITGSVSATGTVYGTNITEIESTTSSLNSYTASNDSTNTTQNNRLTSIETSTGSLNSFTSSTNTKLGIIETTTSSLNSHTSSTNTRLGLIETSTGSLNSFTNSIDTTIKTKMNTDGVLSGSAQVVAALPSGTVSGSSQVLNGTTIHSGSFFNGISVVSGSAQISFGGITGVPSGLVSGSSQVSFGGISNVPSGLVSGSGQITLSSTSGFGSYLNQAVLTSSSPTFANLSLTGLLNGGIGASSTSGTLNWNDSTNARSGQGITLLTGNATNGPGPSEYFHPFSFEYSSKDGSGNMTQFAIPYNSNQTSMYFRGRYAGTWGSWYTMWNSGNDGSGSGLDADLWDGYHFSDYLNQAVKTTSSPTFSTLTLSTSSGTIMSRGGFSDAFGYNPSYGTYIGGGAGNATGYLYAGGYINDGSTVRTLLHSGNYTSYAMSGAGYSANQNLNTTSTPTFAGANLTDRLYLNGGSYEGSILFGSSTVWRCGIRQHDDADAELRIWTVNNNGMIFLANGYNGEPADIARPTDGLVVGPGNNVGIGNFSSVDPGVKFHVKGSNEMIRFENTSTAANQYSQLNMRAGNRNAYLWIGNENSTSWAGAGGLNIYTENGNIDLWSNAVQRVRIQTDGHMVPFVNNTYDLGSSSLGWRNIYTNDLHLSNMNKPEGNDIDGTNGNWTIQEGAENLYIINNNNGKKFKISLEEIK